MKYPELKGKCKECELGCGRLANPEFTGVYRCEFFTEVNKNEKSKYNRNKINIS